MLMGPSNLKGMVVSNVPDSLNTRICAVASPCSKSVNGAMIRKLRYSVLLASSVMGVKPCMRAPSGETISAR